MSFLVHKLVVEAKLRSLCHHRGMDPIAPAPESDSHRPKGRRILMAVTGMTPQVVTETLYGLQREGGHALPHEVHILTTAEGAERVRLALLSESPGWFHRLRVDYHLPPIDFGPANVHVLRAADGTALADIRSADDNTSAADQVADMVRAFTQDPDSQLHVSMAGGRKTLGFFAAYALSLWGRDTDRLTHVLVSEPFESSWEFFYPTPYERIIATREGRLANCAQADVSLADIPFVRLRHGLPRELLSGRTSFAMAVKAAQTQLGPPRLSIDYANRSIEAAGQRIVLAPAELAFLAWFARRASLGMEGAFCPNDGVPSREYADAYLAEYRRVRGIMGDDGRTRARYKQGMTKADFEERKSKLKRALTSALGRDAQPYLIVGEGRRPMKFRLALPPEAIQLDGP